MEFSPTQSEPRENQTRSNNCRSSEEEKGSKAHGTGRAAALRKKENLEKNDKKQKKRRIRSAALCSFHCFQFFFSFSFCSWFCCGNLHFSFYYNILIPIFPIHNLAFIYCFIFLLLSLISRYFEHYYIIICFFPFGMNWFNFFLLSSHFTQIFNSTLSCFLSFHFHLFIFIFIFIFW